MDERLHHLFGRIPDAHVHLYGKQERPGRKIGHVNVVGEDVQSCGSAPSRRRTGYPTASGSDEGEWRR